MLSSFLFNVFVGNNHNYQIIFLILRHQLFIISKSETNEMMTNNWVLNWSMLY